MRAEGEPTTTGPTTGDTTTTTTTAETTTTAPTTTTPRPSPAPPKPPGWHLVREPKTVRASIPVAAQAPTVATSTPATAPGGADAGSKPNRAHRPQRKPRSSDAVAPPRRNSRPQQPGGVLAAQSASASAAAGWEEYASLLIVTALALAIGCFAVVSIPAPYVRWRPAAWFVPQRSLSVTTGGVLFLLAAAALLWTNSR